MNGKLKCLFLILKKNSHYHQSNNAAKCEKGRDMAA